MRSIIKSVTEKQGKHSKYQSIHTLNGKSFLNSITPFPFQGDEIEYEVKDANGYNWTTSLSIIEKEELPVVSLLEQIKLAEMIAVHGLDVVEIAMSEAKDLMERLE